MQKKLFLIKSNTDEKEDMVNHPSHYKAGDLECYDVMLKLYGKEAVMAFCMCNAFKYQWRCNNKGNCRQDIAKARWYNKKFLELLGDE